MIKKEKYSHRLNVRFTEKQWQTILEISEKKDLDKAEIVRKSIQLNYQKIPNPPQPKFDTNTAKKIYLLLNNLTNNTNQVAHQVNIHKQIEVDAINNLINEVTKLCQVLN